MAEPFVVFMSFAGVLLVGAGIAFAYSTATDKSPVVLQSDKEKAMYEPTPDSVAASTPNPTQQDVDWRIEARAREEFLKAHPEPLTFWGSVGAVMVGIFLMSLIGSMLWAIFGPSASRY